MTRWATMRAMTCCGRWPSALSRGLRMQPEDLDNCTTTFGELCQTCPTRPSLPALPG
jgi:hypothetical protein